MRIKIESTELKALLEKVIPVIDKKACIKSLQCVLLKSENGTLTATTTDALQAWLTVKTNKFTSLEDGSILIHESELKLITKLSDELEIFEISDKVTVKSSKKSIAIELVDIKDFPEYITSEKNIELFTIQEKTFNAAIGKLINFVSYNESNKVMQCYNINPKENRIEALDGHRIGIIDIVADNNASTKSTMIDSRINADLKKVLNSRSFNQLRFAEQDKYITISGEDFTYSQRIVDGEYYNIGKILPTDYTFKLILDKTELQEISKFNIDMIKADCKDEKKPMIFNFNNTTKQNHVYMNTGKHQTVDKLEIKKSDMNNDLTIAFNPTFIYEALKCLDDEQITIIGSNPKAPILISGTNERYLILPVNIGSYADDMERCIRDAA